ncbi:MAG TPA: cold shock domain-containing protein [Clostridia bacterium]|nr:cold shock domain-containing protein [Clostridia bacterium]
MNAGTIVWYNENQGFGFISPDGGGNKLYFNSSQRDSLTVGQEVTFDIKINPNNKRQIAVNVVPKA